MAYPNSEKVQSRVNELLSQSRTLPYNMSNEDTIQIYITREGPGQRYGESLYRRPKVPLRRKNTCSITYEYLITHRSIISAINALFMDRLIEREPIKISWGHTVRPDMRIRLVGSEPVRVILSGKMRRDDLSGRYDREERGGVMRQAGENGVLRISWISRLMKLIQLSRTRRLTFA